MNGEVMDAIKHLAALKKNIKAKLIWENLAKVAAEIKSPNRLLICQ